MDMKDIPGLLPRLNNIERSLARVGGEHHDPVQLMPTKGDIDQLREYLEGTVMPAVNQAIQKLDIAAAALDQAAQDGAELKDEVGAIKQDVAALKDAQAASAPSTSTQQPAPGGTGDGTEQQAPNDGAQTDGAEGQQQS